MVEQLSGVTAEIVTQENYVTNHYPVFPSAGIVRDWLSLTPKVICLPCHYANTVGRCSAHWEGGSPMRPAICVATG